MNLSSIPYFKSKIGRSKLPSYDAANLGPNPLPVPSLSNKAELIYLDNEGLGNNVLYSNGSAWLCVATNAGWSLPA